MTIPQSRGHLLIIGAADVRRALPMSDCIEVIARTMGTVSRGGAQVPARTVFPVGTGGNLFAAMPGYVESPSALGAKVIAVYPQNPQQGISSHSGVIVVFNPQSGTPEAIVDASEVTAMRTAAASAVATRALARSDAGVLAILGTGEQASTHLEAITTVRRLRSVRIWGRSVEKARAFATREGGRHGISIKVSASVREAVENADIVCTVTASREPILEGTWLTPGAHVNLVGASRVTAREADDEVVTRSRFYVDYRQSALSEAGELRHAIDAGLVGASHVVGEIGDVLNGNVAGRSRPDEITVYKSVGIAAQDLATAQAICERAARLSLGTRVPF